ncbi:YIP1 family protein [Pelotomaculum isophthalicicum JI]|uniref:YIP1 family protein n=1 Tax=Pelotomaculum isophthalicicum JI TaxID=947010 RepID=A0A9X4H7B2_9FIRM|nr:Yip1 family protein [Pelotomaculum isophthalicicum]MDF9407609.1 YIP1 family protein [Pelotomaculum isophthalicicum JI]
MDVNLDREDGEVTDINLEFEQSPGGGEPRRQDFLELVYGVLFDPLRTLEAVAKKPPVALAFLIFTVICILDVTMGLLTVSRAMTAGLYNNDLENFLSSFRALAPLGAVFGLFWGYLKWFGYSAFIHLAAELLGGKGVATGVLVVVGLAGMPSIFMVPVNLLSLWLGTGGLIIIALAGLATVVWSVVLLVIGLKQVHGLTAGRSFLVVVSPFLLLLVLFIIIIAALVAVAASMPFGMHNPVYF